MVMPTFHTSKSFVCLVYKTVDWSGAHSTLTTFGQVRIPHIKLGRGWQGRSQLSTKDPRSPGFSC